jgi:hypothetical protein
VSEDGHSRCRPMRTLIAATTAAALLAGAAAQGQSFKATSLDQNIIRLKEARSLAALCGKEPEIKECRYAIGEWKPEELERAKLEVPICFDQCMQPRSQQKLMACPMACQF